MSEEGAVKEVTLKSLIDELKESLDRGQTILNEANRTMKYGTDGERAEMKDELEELLSGTFTVVRREFR